MRTHLFGLVLAASSVATGAALAQGPAGGTVVRGTFIDTGGEEVGTVTLTQTPAGVLVSAEAQDLPAGTHGFHIHETGVCDPATGFKSAGGHFAGGKAHGFLVEDGPHPGDMPNVTVARDNTLKVEILNDRISLKDGAESSVFDDDGAAVVIHAGEDDYRSQPAGDAGERIACAVIDR